MERIDLHHPEVTSSYPHPQRHLDVVYTFEKRTKGKVLNRLVTRPTGA